MNMMGIDIDGLGNHNFDYGADYFRQQLVPLANYPFVSSNIVDANGNTPAEWKKSQTFNFPDGVEVAIVGFSNDDIPSFTRPGALDPFHVANSLDPGQCRGGQGRQEANAVVAIGHLGATDGTLTTPTGPLLDLANGVANVDVVVGDHTDQQALTTPPNGVLVTENRSKGLRFTRIRIVDRHRQRRRRLQDGRLPQAVGHRRHAGRGHPGQDQRAQRAARADLQHLVGKSTKIIPRADAVRPPNGPELRVVHRRPRHRRDPQCLRHGLRAHQLRRPARRPDLPVRRFRSERPGLLPAGVYPNPDAPATTRSRAARCSACCRSAMSPRR